MREREEVIVAAARHAFLARFLEDCARGAERTLAEYEELFPRHAQVVAEEYARLHATQTLSPERAEASSPQGSFPASVLEGGPPFSSDSVSQAVAQIESHGYRRGRLRAEHEVARGGQGAVLAAWDALLQRRLAMKVALAPTASASTPATAQSLGRFLQEAQVTAQLDHPGVVPVHDLGLDPEGRVYFTMKLVRGRDLRAIFALVHAGEEGWTETRALNVLLKVCEAMAYAHSKGVIHRDLKPSNVMVGRFGEVYVMDWGLARVLASAGDPEPPVPDALHSPPQYPGSKADATLGTRDGDVMGTPAFMAPEQARGEVASIGPQTDVYALGAMLYQLLTGRMPYVPPGARLDRETILERVQRGPPEPMHRLAPRVPAELVAICEQAMAREVAARYAHMGELADDLRAFLEHRVVSAYETGPVAELRKWIERNRWLAASIAAALLALVAGLTASLVFKARSDEHAAEASANEERAKASEKRAQEGEALANRRTDEVFRLSALQRLDDLIAKAARLWPATPENAPGYELWLRDAERLAGELADHETKLAELRTRAIPWTEEEQVRERASHPRFAELEHDRRHLQFHRNQAAGVERGEAARCPTPEEAGLDPATLPTDPAILQHLALPLVDPERKDWGSEAKGLVLARRAVDLATELSLVERAALRDTLAWAYFANGLFDQAMAEEEKALEEAGTEHAEEFRSSADRLKNSIDDWIGPEGQAKEAAHISGLEKRVAALEAEVSRRSEWRFADTQDKWWHNQLEKLVERLQAFGDPESGLFSSGISREYGWGMKRRLEFAQTIEERSVSGPEASARWSQAIASIRDTGECPAYHGLVLSPQLGLLPIGRDPSTGLWEFAHLQTGEPAQRSSTGELLLREETGVVLVLLPGGAFLMGAQSHDPNGPNFVERPIGDEDPVHEVTVAAFFMSKYEMTQGQWLRITGRNPSQYGRHNYDLKGWSRSKRKADLLHPVESVSWFEAMDACARLGLVLPSTEQWEYADRAGTHTPWWTGNDPSALARAGNVADAWAKANGGPPDWAFEPWDDGYSVHASVGTFAANPFGLCETIGNVHEWCSDSYDPSFHHRPGQQDPLGDSGKVPFRILRGGSFMTDSLLARSSSRLLAPPDFIAAAAGLRPAMELRP